MPKLGVNSKMYLNNATYPAPTWNEASLISDCNVAGDWDEGEASARMSRIKAAEPTMAGVEITGKIRVMDALLLVAYNLMYGAYYRDLPLDVLVLNGRIDETGSSGYRFLGKVFQWSEDQSLGVVLYKDFSIKPCIPIEIGGSTVAPTFTYRLPKVANVIAGVIGYLDIGQG